MSDPTKVSRRLVAVFAADVVGYSRLMGADEVRTLKRLTERRAILDSWRRSEDEYLSIQPKVSPTEAEAGIICRS
jgi:hypothetical protein